MHCWSKKNKKSFLTFPPDIRKVTQRRIRNLEHGHENELPDVVIAGRKNRPNRHDVAISERLRDAGSDGHVVHPAAVAALERNPQLGRP